MIQGGKTMCTCEYSHNVIDTVYKTIYIGVGGESNGIYQTIIHIVELIISGTFHQFDNYQCN
jgi:hypothetical protein